MAQIHMLATNEYDTMLHGSKSLFTSGYKQHTKYASEFQSIPIHGAGYGTTRIAQIPVRADLLHTCMVAMTMKKKGQGWYPIERAIRRVSVVIHGEIIDTHTSEWFRMYDEIYREPDTRHSYQSMTNFHHKDEDGTVKTLYMPLIFWFCRDMTRSLPIVDTLELHFDMAQTIEGIDMSFPPKFDLICEFVHVTPEERLVLMEREYIIDTMHMIEHQITFDEKHHIYNVNLSIFKHPLQALIWTCMDPHKHGVHTASGYPLEDSDAFAPLKRSSISISGNILTDVTYGSWFQVSNALRKHSRIPAKGIYMHDFGVDPNIASGTINMSVIRNPILTVETKKIVTSNKNAPVDVQTDTFESARNLTRLYVFAHCWNSLVIKDGQAVLRYI